VQFTLGADALSLINADMQRAVEPGTFDIMVGPSSAETATLPRQVEDKPHQASLQ
jgi:hypothetical protein